MSGMQDTIEAMEERVRALTHALQHIADRTYPATYLGTTADGRHIYGSSTDASDYARSELERLA